MLGPRIGGNLAVAVATFAEPADRLRVASSVFIQHDEDNPFDFLVDDHAVMHPFDYAPEDRVLLAPFQQAVYPADGKAVQRWMDGLGLRRPMETFTLLDHLNRTIAGRFSPSSTIRVHFSRNPLFGRHRRGQGRHYKALSGGGLPGWR